jgi:hypothetical protein
VTTDATRAKDGAVKVVNEAEAAHEALQVSQASEESPRAKLNSLQSKAACTSDSVLGTASSGAAQTSQLVEIPSLAQRVVVNGVGTMLSVVISYYNGTNFPSIGQGFTAGQSNEEIGTFEEEASPLPSH